jgi:glycosyltransferase involved in cell wall biosynthesis
MMAASIWDGTYSRDVAAAIGRSARVIVYNRVLADFVRDRFGRICDVVPGGVNPGDFEGILPHQKEDFRVRPFRILAPGRMSDPAKGADDVIAAVRELRKEGADVNVTVTRDKTGATEPWLHEIGWVEPTVLESELARCHCVVVPSRWQEAFGMAWLEALAASRPVICSRVAGPAEHLIHEHNALLYPPGDSERLATCIRYLMENPGQADFLVRNGLELACSLTWDAAAEKTGAILEQARTAAPSSKGKNE